MPFPLPRVLGLTQGLLPPVPVLTADGLCLCSRGDLHRAAAPGPPSRAACPQPRSLPLERGTVRRSEPLRHPPAALRPVCRSGSGPRRHVSTSLRREDATWVGALRGHCLHLSQARVVRVPKGPYPVGHERTFVAGPGGCLLVRLGSTCWLVSDSRVRPTPTPKSELQGGRGLWRVPSAGGLGGADPGCGESLPRPW